MDSPITYLSQFAETGKLNWLDGNELWVQQYPFDSWSHPVFGETTIDREKALKLKKSFDDGVRGQKIFADYEHGLDKAKGNKASGQIKELKVIDEPRGLFTAPGLWARVSFTDNARKEIESGEWNYWSTSHYDTWTHPQTKTTHEFVYDGGGVTNHPYVKGMVPLNFSELGVEDTVATEAASEDAPPVVELVEDTAPPVIYKNNENEGGDNDLPKLEQFQKELRDKLGLAEDADIITAVSDLNDEVKPIRDALKVHNEKKAFSEQFPEEYKRMLALEASEDARKAKQFSESFAGVRLTKQVGEKSEETTQGFSALVLEKLEEVAKQFNEGTPSLDSVKELVDSVAKNGIVDYGNKGSSREDETKLFNEDEVARGSMSEIRKAFAEKVSEVATEGKISFSEALPIAAAKYPKLADAYHGAGMVNA